MFLIVLLNNNNPDELCLFTAESTKPKQRPRERERVKEKKPSKPVRKVHRSSSAPDSNVKPGLNSLLFSHCLLHTVCVPLKQTTVTYLNK